MLRSVKELRGYTIRARDGEIGKVHAFLFDDRAWIVRYLVVNTGNWLAQRLVLIVPAALQEPDWTEQIFPVDLDSEQVKESPEIDVDKPVSRQQEIDLHRHYHWSMYWVVDPGIGALGVPPAPPVTGTDIPSNDTGETEEGDPNLRSTREIIGYGIAAHDDDIGRVDDFILEDDGWFLRYAVADTRTGIAGKQFLLAVSWIERIDWHEGRVNVDLMRNQIENSPTYDPAEPINRQYEERLYDYYGRPCYWE